MLAHLFDKFIQKELEHQEAGEIRFGDEQPDRPDSVKSRTTLQTPQEAAPETPAAAATVPPTPSITIPPPPVPAPAPVAPNEHENGPRLPLTAVTTNVEQSPYSPQAPINHGPYTAPLSSTTQPDYFSGAHHTPIRRESSVQLPPAAALPTSPLSPTGSTFMNRLKNLSVKAKLSRVPTNEDKLPTQESLATSASNTLLPSVDEQQQQETAAAAAEKEAAAAEKAEVEAKAAKAAAAEEAKLKEIEEKKSESYTPPHLEDFPPLDIPPSTMIIVAEESAEASTGMDLYRGTVGSTDEDADTIIGVAPTWLLSYLLYVSVSFI